MRNVIIFEGPDGSGKTTAAKTVAKRLKAQLIHTGPPDNGMTAFQQYCNMLDNIRDSPLTHPVVFDRFHLGERVYGPVFRGKDTLGALGQRILEKELNTDFRTALVLCRPPLSVARTTWRARSKKGEEMLDSESQFLGVFERYLHVWSDLPTIAFNFTRDTPHWLCQQIQQVL